MEDTAFQIGIGKVSNHSVSVAVAFIDHAANARIMLFMQIENTTVNGNREGSGACKLLPRNH